MADTTATYQKGKLYDLPIIDLKPDPNQPRKSMDPQALEELAASIRTHGIIQPILFRVGIGGHDPISPEIGIVSPYSPGTLIIVAGERRYKAAQQAGLLVLPGICVEGNPSEIALVENLLRQDLTPIEEAEALDRLLTEQSYTHEQLAAIIGKARNTLTEILSLNRLPPEIRDECRSSTTTARKTLIEIARKKQDRSMITAWGQYKDKLAKAASGRAKREKVPGSAMAVLNLVSKTVSKLGGLDMSAWTEDEKNAFNQTLMELHESIQAILNPSEAPSNLA
jgi:ParB family chromosome partitioning protein